MIKLFNSRKILTAVLFILWLNYFISPAGSQNNSVKSAHTFVEMIPQFETLKAGETFYVGFNFVTDKDWHIYWQNPGDSGLAPKIEWNLPNDFQAGEIIWPAPERIKAEPLTSFGYHHGAFLLTEIQSPSDFENQKELMLSAKVSWLECKEECLPGEGEFHINILLTQADATVNPTYLKHYDKYKSQYFIEDISANASMIQTPTDFIIKYIPSTFDEGLIFTDFFPYDSNLIDYNVLPEFKTLGQITEIKLRKALNYQEGKNDRLRGILVGHIKDSDEMRSFEINVSMPSNFLQKEADESPRENKLHIFLAIIFAFWGGMVLNLMPCVLPVLTIKVLGLLEKSKNEKSKILNNGLQFTLGILVSFWVLSIIMLLLRFVGKQVGWGYQFQSPYFVVAMTILFFVLALNLFGLFEIGTTFTRLKSTEFAFLNGVLATLVATPCTAPFMGSAIGFALVKPPIYTFIIFTSIGIGMAFPYFILTCFPRLLKFVPKPGAWIIYLKQFFGFIMTSVVIWLVWVLSIQRGSEAVILILIGLFSIAFGLWLHRICRGQKGLLFLIIFCSIGLYISFYAGSQPVLSIVGERKIEIDKINWEVYDPARFDQYLSENKPVFLDFTAAWCLSCQVNERTVFYNQTVIDRFNKLSIVSIKADWTNYDPEITKALNAYGKNGIPLYVFYPKGNQGEYVILPEIITPQIILSTLDKYLNE